MPPSLTIAGALVTANRGTLRPMMYGRAHGLFDRNPGLTGGSVSAVCHLALSACVALGIATLFLPLTALPRTVAPPPRPETAAS